MSLGQRPATVTLVDSSLRDGMHSLSHQFTPRQVADIAAGLDQAGVSIIEVSHGDGLGGSSIQYGQAAASDEEYVVAAVDAVSRASIAVLLLPGIGTIERLKVVKDRGASVARIATHCTEADISQQHIEWARKAGMTVVGFLMMSHMVDTAKLVEQAQLMEAYGAHVVYIVDSAGALLPAGARERVAGLRDALEIDVGFHAHNNLGCAVGNTLAAIEQGATYVDGSLRGLGAGAGNSQTEVLCTALELAGHRTGIDLFALMDLAEEIVAPLMPQPPLIDRAALSLGYAGVYSSFLLHAERAAAKYGVDVREVLLELGRRSIVGGQEDMIIDVAAEMAGNKSLTPAA